MNIIELLNEKNPKFQLKSGIEELPSSEGFFCKNSNRTDTLERQSHAIALDVLEWITNNVTKEMSTIETGGGWSTCTFAAYSKYHICVNPDITANEMIKTFLDENDIGSNNLSFINEPSDVGLPKLNRDLSFDVALIDGNHSYPIPIIDWHYIDLHLNKNGILMVDDAHVKSVNSLCEYLDTEESYKYIGKVGRLKLYKKILDERIWGWADQNYNK